MAYRYTGARRNRVSLHVERLEGRELPTTFTWVGGGVSNLWSSPANWNRSNSTGEHLHPIGESDAVIFSAVSVRNSVHDLPNLTVGEFASRVGYTGTITLSQSLTVAKEFYMGAGMLKLVNDRGLTIRDSSGLSLWEGGTIGGSGLSRLRIEPAQSGRDRGLIVRQLTSQSKPPFLDVSTIIGSSSRFLWQRGDVDMDDTSTTITVSGDFIAVSDGLFGPHAGGRMGPYAVYLETGGVIRKVGYGGATLRRAQVMQNGGKIEVADPRLGPGAFSTLIVDGTLDTRGKDAEVTVEGGGRLRVTESFAQWDGTTTVSGRDSRIEVQGWFYQAGGTFTITPESRLMGPLLITDGGELRVTGSYPAWHGVIETNGFLYVGASGKLIATLGLVTGSGTGVVINAGTMELSRGGLIIVGNLVQTGSGNVINRMHGPGAYERGTLSVDGHATLDGTLTVRLEGWEPPRDTDVVAMTWMTREGEFSQHVFPSGWGPWYEYQILYIRFGRGAGPGRGGEFSPSLESSAAETLPSPVLLMPRGGQYESETTPWMADPPLPDCRVSEEPQSNLDHLIDDLAELLTLPEYCSPPRHGWAA